MGSEVGGDLIQQYKLMLSSDCFYLSMKQKVKLGAGSVDCGGSVKGKGEMIENKKYEIIISATRKMEDIMGQGSL